MGPTTPGTDVITATAGDGGGPDDFAPPDDSAGPVALAAASGVANKIWVADTPVPGCASVKGYGYIKVAGKYASFNIDVKQTSTAGLPGGEITYDRASGKKFRSTSITSVVVNGAEATIIGMGRVNDGLPIPFRVDVVDGYPDTFHIEWLGYSAEGHVLYGKLSVRSDCKPHE